jgi:hypothetical protein
MPEWSEYQDPDDQKKRTKKEKNTVGISGHQCAQDGISWRKWVGFRVLGFGV